MCTLPSLSVALSFLTLMATRSQPSMAEGFFAVAFVLSQLDGRLLSNCAYVPLAFFAMLLGALTSHPLLSLWLDQRQLNANFFYISTLLFVGGQLLLVYDATAPVICAETKDAVDMQELESAARKVQLEWRARRGNGKSAAGPNARS